MDKDAAESAEAVAPPSPDVEAMWREEEALSDEQRRARYRCRAEDVVVGSSLSAVWETHEGVPRNSLSERVRLYVGNVVHLECDAVVNAANERCLGGGGIDGAIHRAAGRRLYHECRTLNGCPLGDARITRGYDLPAKFVLHTVGPMGEKEEPLRSCYTRCCELALRYRLKSVAFCCVSSGIFGYPLEAAARVQLDVITRWMEAHPEAFESVIIVAFLPREVEVYRRLLPQYLVGKKK